MTATDLEHRNITIGDHSGVRQGSILGLTLWNMYCDGVLRIPTRDGVRLLAYADDLAVIVCGKSIQQIEAVTNASHQRCSKVA